MFSKKLIMHGSTLLKNRSSSTFKNFVKTVHVTCKTCSEDKSEEEPKSLIVKRTFENVEDKTKNNYLEMIKIFVNRDHIYRRGHVEFIYSALKNMEEYGVNKDLEVYKALLEVFPKGKMVAQNMFQVEFMHYPKQQQCAIDVLEQMEDNGVMPDTEMEDILVNVFGDKAFPLRKYWRLMYWMPKFKNLSPWPIPDPLPNDVFELAKYAIERISSVDVKSAVTVYQTADIKESIDDTWIVSAQSEKQQQLLEQQNVDKPVFVEGPFKVWIKQYPINYFILRGEPRPYIDEDFNPDDISNIKIPKFIFTPPVADRVRVIPSVHEQEDGVLYSLCATGTSSKDSLLSWIRHLEKDGNPSLAKLSIVFTLRSGKKEVAKVQDDVEQIEEKQSLYKER